MPSVVTANDLRSGAVVYLGRQGLWVEALADAFVASDPEQLKSLEGQALDAVVRNEVTAVYAMEVRATGGATEPVSVRERIRAAHAPTV